MKNKKSVKIPQARQLPSGSWFVRVMVDGERIPITRDTEKECIAAAMALKVGLLKAKKVPLAEKTLTQAIDLWIEDNGHRLSPATVRGYRTCQRNGFQGLMKMRCKDISDAKIASAINEECKKYSSKTVVNRWRFINQVLAWATKEAHEPELPQVVVPDTEFLDDKQIDVFLKHIKGTKVEITALLALSSLRRSEIAALNWDEGSIDLEYRWIRVRGAVVPDEKHKMVQKATNKNTKSRRDVPMIDPLYEALKAVENKHGRVVPQHPATMLTWINKACREAGLPEVGCHGLRHSFASLCHILKIPAQVAMEIGGWSDRTTMDKIYTHVSKRQVDSYVNDFTDHFKAHPEGQIGNENGNGA